MLRIALIPFLTILVVIAVFLVSGMIAKRRRRSREEALNQKYTYRKEPCADQVAEQPNRLRDNDVTGG